jgi:hypothetical protein
LFRYSFFKIKKYFFLRIENQKNRFIKKSRRQQTGSLRVIEKKVIRRPTFSSKLKNIKSHAHLFFHFKYIKKKHLKFCSMKKKPGPALSPTQLKKISKRKKADYKKIIKYRICCCCRSFCISRLRKKF